MHLDRLRRVGRRIVIAASHLPRQTSTQSGRPSRLPALSTFHSLLLATLISVRKATPVAPAAKLDSLHIPPIRKKRGGDQTHDIRARNSSVRISQSRGDEEEEKSAASTVGGATMLPKPYSWKIASPRLPPSRHLGHILRSSKTWMLLGLLAVLGLLWTSMGSAAGEMQRYTQCAIRNMAQCLHTFVPPNPQTC